MHLFKRLAGGLMALVLAVSLMPAASASQFYSYILDANDSAEIAAMVDVVSEQTFAYTDAATVQNYIEHFLYNSDFSAINGGRFPYTNAQGYWAGKSVSDGTYYQVVNATGCYAYCKFVSQVIYGTAGLQRNLEQRAGKITADGLKNFLKKYAQAGEHIRVGDKHSFTYVSGTEQGFYYLDYAGDQNPRIWLRYTTYKNFAAHCNSLYKRVWIYEANNVVNTEHWFKQYSVAAQSLGLTGDASIRNCNDNLTLAECVTLTARAHDLFTEGNAGFKALDGEAWYEPYVIYLMNNQILTEDFEDYLAGTTREQFVNLLIAALPENETVERINDPISFADEWNISNSYAVSLFYEAGILTGVKQSDGVYFYPDSTITRGEAVTMLTRLAMPELRVSI